MQNCRSKFNRRSKFPISLAELHIRAGNKAAGCADSNDISLAERSAAKRNAKEKSVKSSKLQVSRGGAKQTITRLATSTLSEPPQSK